jgi:hypothetical protein
MSHENHHDHHSHNNGHVDSKMCNLDIVQSSCMANVMEDCTINSTSCETAEMKGHELIVYRWLEKSCQIIMNKYTAACTIFQLAYPGTIWKAVRLSHQSFEMELFQLWGSLQNTLDGVCWPHTAATIIPQPVNANTILKTNILDIICDLKTDHKWYADKWHMITWEDLIETGK